MSSEKIILEKLDGRRYIPLEDWCEREGITPANARGYYIPKGRVEGAAMYQGKWWIPRKSRLQRQRQSRQKKSSSKTPVASSDEEKKAAPSGSRKNAA